MSNFISFLYCTLISFALFSQLPPPKPKYNCPTNGNAESGNYTNWTRYTGAATEELNPSSFVVSTDPARFGIHNNTSNYNPYGPIPMLVSGVDQYGLFQVPSEGSYCFSVGNNKTGAQAEIMKYTFTVTNENKNFKFRYALVLQDGGHTTTSGINPSATFYFVKGNKIAPGVGDVTIVDQTLEHFVADLSNPYYKRSSVNPSVVYRSWECMEYDLSSYVGQQVSFVVHVKDCTEGGHFGYMYIDGLCTEWPAIADFNLNGTEFCLNNTIIMNGALSTGEDRYYVEVAEVEEFGSYVVNGLNVNKWFVASQVPDGFNISNFVASFDKQLECNKFYDVKVAVANYCAVWNSKSIRIKIKCPPLELGPDKVSCCNSIPVLTTIGPNPTSGYSYLWSSIPAGYSSTLSKITVAPSTNTAYILTVTEPNGCYNKDTILFRFEPTALNLNLSTSYDLCDPRPIITANISGYNCAANISFANLFGEIDFEKVSWYFINPLNPNTPLFLGKGRSIKASNLDGKVRAVYNSSCGSVLIKEIDVFYRQNGRGLIYPNTVFPNSTIVKNRQLIIQEFGTFAPLNFGEGPAYDIKDFRLRIYNRWGENFRTITKATVGRLPHENVMQGDIKWDAKDNSGTLVQGGTYAFTLEMMYCGTDVFVPIEIPGGEYEICIDRDNFLNICTRWLTGKWGTHVNIEY